MVGRKEGRKEGLREEAHLKTLLDPPAPAPDRARHLHDADRAAREPDPALAEPFGDAGAEDEGADPGGEAEHFVEGDLHTSIQPHQYLSISLLFFV